MDKGIFCKDGKHIFHVGDGSPSKACGINDPPRQKPNYVPVHAVYTRLLYHFILN